MKFTLALAIGAQAVKLHQEDEFYILDRAEAYFEVVDWNGSGTVDVEELKDFAYASEAFGYIDEEQLIDAYYYADEMGAYFGGEFAFEDVEDELTKIVTSGDISLAQDMSDVLEFNERVMIDSAIWYNFEELDADGDGYVYLSEW